MIRIAVDAMGGDFAPEEIIAGAIQAAREMPIELVLTGLPEAIETELKKHNTTGLKLTIEPAPDVVRMDEQPTSALRQKPRASILVNNELVRDRRADAAVTMGHSGAGMVAAVWALGRIEGIQRPAAGITYFGLQPRTFLLDLGLNVDCKPQYLLQFALMGSIYMREIQGIENPTVALLSNGAEDNKGHEVAREAFPLLKKSGLNFIGNVEAHDLAYGKANVIVADGFAGNIALKLTEGLTEILLDAVEREVSVAVSPDVWHDNVAPAIARVRQMMDYMEIGGAPVLGVNGVSVIGHGRSRARAVVSAIRQARTAVEHDLVEAIRRGWEILAKRENV